MNDARFCPLRLSLIDDHTSKSAVITDTVNITVRRIRGQILNYSFDKEFFYYRWDDLSDDSIVAHRPITFGPFLTVCQQLLHPETPANVFIDAVLECDDTPPLLLELFERLARSGVTYA